MNPFRAAQTSSMLGAMLPAWAARGNCAGRAPNSAPYGPFFDDDVAYSTDPNAYEWPKGVLGAMKLCSTCPVRPQCLTYAYESEARVQKSYWASESLTKADGRRFGVWGGTPGRIREHFADPADAAAWFESFAADRGWVVLDEQENLTA